MKEKIEALKALAEQLPTGLYDPKALDKMEREMEEAKEAVMAGDMLGAVMEGGDIAYYAIKAESSGICDESQRDKFIEYAAGFVGLVPTLLLDCAIAKYALRARPGNPKDDERERAAVAAVL
jgi:hypothetical protein